MSAHSQSSGPRSNAYSESKFSNWTAYQPFHSECAAGLRRIAKAAPSNPAKPMVLAMPLREGFRHPCRVEEVEWALDRLPSATIEGLRAVVQLGGNQRQLNAWLKGNRLPTYGAYWRECIFVFAYPRGYWTDLDWLRDFFLKGVLVHEIGHHVDRHRNADSRTKEGFASAFARQYGKRL
jgi:hypothetical protein